MDEALHCSWAEISNENSIFNVGQGTKENKMDPQPAGFQVNKDQNPRLPKVTLKFSLKQTHCLHRFVVLNEVK